MVAPARATKALALLGVGILLLFIAYLGWQDQYCNDLNRGPGAVPANTPCDTVAYPWRGTYILGFAFLVGSTFIIMGLILLAKVERTEGRKMSSRIVPQDNQMQVD